MKLDVKVITNLKTKEVENKVKKASSQGLKDVIVDIANDTKKLSPFLTGHNRRSIKFEVGPGGEIAKSESEGAVYSTSGYGGWLEIGHGESPNPRPYFKPALDKNAKNLPRNIKVHL